MDVSSLEKVMTRLELLISRFPDDSINYVLFGDWSIQEVVKHLSGWNIQRISEIESVRDGYKVFCLIERIDSSEFNKIVLTQKRYYSWKNTKEEFKASNKELLSLYKSFPTDLLDIVCEHDREVTVVDYYNIDLMHLQNDHLVEIEKVLKNIEND